MSVDKEVLLKRSLPEGTVEIEAGTLRIRGLSRTEAMKVRGLQDKPDEAELFMLKAAVLEPQLDSRELRDWYDTAPLAETEKVLAAILELSGLTGGDARFQGGTGADAG